MLEKKTLKSSLIAEISSLKTRRFILESFNLAFGLLRNYSAFFEEKEAIAVATV